MPPILFTYVLYLLVSLGLTVWVARTLSRNGRRFLVATFQGEADLADSVNHLLVVGFYLVNLGFITLALKAGLHPANAAEVFELLSTKVGVVLLVLGGMHFGNLYLFQRLYRRSKRPNGPGEALRTQPPAEVGHA
jgi:hypothetical protein